VFPPAVGRVKDELTIRFVRVCYCVLQPMIIQELNNAEPVPFEITPTSLENVKKVRLFVRSLPF
jgi:hypothetical protein